VITLKAKHSALMEEIMKFRGSVELYRQSGRQLSDEIIRVSQMSYEKGEIDFFQFVISMESALEIILNYYENLNKYNQIALEVNYLTN
jgi:cobalt-zinc-cadmium resistance protein CzcA